MPDLNFERLVLARQYRLLSQKELASVVDVTQASLSRIEKGDLTPSDTTKSRIIEALNFPESFFYDEFPLHTSTLSFHAYRKKASVSALKINQIHAELAIKGFHHQLLTAVPNQIKPPELPSHIRNAADLADYLRNHWGVGNSPIDDLTHYVESMGIDIFLCDFQDVSVDGVTSKTLNNQKAIFLNKNQSADRFRFSLAHELCHYFLHANEVCATQDMEDEANEFASLLLMPECALRSVLCTTNLRAYGELKQIWKVSMAALIYRAKTLKSISEAQATSLYKQMSMHGFRKVEPFAFEMERPQRVHQLLHAYAKSRSLDSSLLPDALHVSHEDFRHFYPNFYAAQEKPVT